MPEPDYDTSSCIIPPEGHDKVGESVFSLLAEILEDKENRGLIDRWNRAYELRQNKHWKAKSSPGLPLISANLIGVNIQRTTNQLTDNNPTFNIVQAGNIDENQKEALLDIQRTTEHWWNETEQQDLLESSVINGESYGIAIEKLIFNPVLESGIGDAETVVVDPFHFGVYPVDWKDSKNLQKQTAILHFYPMSIWDVKRKYGAAAAEVKADEDWMKEIGDTRTDVGSDKKSSFLNKVFNSLNILLPGQNKQESTGDKSDKAIVCECWCRDYTEIPDGEPFLDPYANQYKQKMKPKYPGNVRMVAVTNGGEIVLQDAPNPSMNWTLPVDQLRMTYLFDKYPFAAVNSVKDTSNGWGMTDISQLEWIQHEFNKALSQFVNVKDKSSRNKLVNPKSSGVQNSAFNTEAGIVNPVSAQEAQAIRWIDPPPANIDFDKAIALFKDMFFLVSGTFDLDQAQGPGRDVIAYKAIAALMERANTMMRGKVRSYSRLIRERGRMYVSMVQNFYTEDRWITYNDTDGKPSVKPINGKNMIVPANITVVSGSTMPVSKVQQREESLALFERKAIDQQELLDKLGWSNWPDVVKRMQAGPLGMAVQNWQQIGMPPELAKVLVQIGGVDPTKMRTAMDDGTVPQFSEILAIVNGIAPTGKDEQAEPKGVRKSDAEIQADVALKTSQSEKSRAESKKIEAETMLTMEKIATERLLQRVKIAGVKFDTVKLEIEKKKIIAGLETDIAKMTQADRDSRRAYNEKGLSSNNE